MTSSQTAIQYTQQWLDSFVIGLNLCPFAPAVVKEKSLRISSCEMQDDRALVVAVLTELQLLQERSEQQLSTSLLIFPRALTDFDEYLGFSELANELLVEAGLDGIIQIATFHPHYCFDGAAEEDVSNYSNRSPYPMLHFIREAQLSRMLAVYPDPEAIADNNIATLKAMGKKKVLALFKRYQEF